MGGWGEGKRRRRRGEGQRRCGECVGREERGRGGRVGEKKGKGGCFDPFNLDRI